MVHVGFGQYVAQAAVVAILSPRATPIQRLLTKARDEGRVLDATHGRRTRSVIRLVNGDIVLSAFEPETVAARMQSGNGGRTSVDGV